MMVRSSLVALSLVLAVPALGCAGTVAGEPPPSSDTATTRAPLAVTAHGPVKLFGEALGDVPLTASQRSSIEQLATQAEARHQAAGAARKDVMLALAGQIEAGQIDRAALQPKLDAVTAAMRASQPADRAAFEQLHAILGPDQRVAFVDAVQAHMGQHRGEMHGKHPLHELAAQLGLSDDQKAQIMAAMPQHHGEQVMQAFKQDRFVFDEVAPAQDVSGHVARMSDHVLSLAEVALPVLTPDQRKLAAQKLRDRIAAGDEGLLELH